MKSEARAAAQEEAISAGEPTGERVSPLDPDFLLMIGFAVFFDILDIIFEAFGLLSAGTLKAVTIGIDAFLAVFIGGWIYWRTGKIIKSKQQQIQAIQQRLGRTSAQMQKQLAKAAAKPLRRTILRAGLAFLGEVIDIAAIGLFPFWTITVIMTLRETGE